MDAGMALGLLLALSAAFLFNLSYMLQHGALGGTPELTLRRPLRTVKVLFGDRKWLAGTSVGLAGFGLHAFALALAPLSIVQAFLASGLAFAVPMSVRMAGHVLTARDSIGATMMVTALVLLAFGTGEHGATNDFEPVTLGGFAVAMAALAAGGTLVRGRRRPEALALAAGAMFGLGDALINALVGIVRGGLVDLATSPWLLACIAANAAAFFVWQQSLQSGRAKVLAVVVLMTAATKISAIGAGFAVFGDSLGATPSWEAIHALCFAAIGLAGWMLAPAQAAITVSEEGIGGASGEAAAGWHDQGRESEGKGSQ